MTRPPAGARRGRALRAMGIGLALGILTAGPTPAAAPATLTPAQLQPQPSDSRAYLGSYSFWVATDDGGTLFASVLLSNLAGTPTRPAVSIAWYPPGGAPVIAEAEAPAESLRVAGPPLKLQLDGGSLHQDGAAWVLGLRAPDGAGRPVALDLRLTPGAPTVAFPGMPLAVDSGRFWLGHLFSTGAAQGTLTVAGKATALRGQAYGDSSWQDAWAHKIARRWVNLRFFSDGPDLALTTFTRPDGGEVARGVLAEGGAAVAVVEKAAVTLGEGGADEASGYPLPTHLRVDAGAGGRLDLDLGAPIDRRDLLGSVSPVLKQLISWLVARPFAYRFRHGATLSLPDGRAVPGIVVAEVIYVNPP